MNKDVQKILRRIRRNGWDYRTNGDGHIEILRPGGDLHRFENGLPVTLPCTPSDTRRTIAQMENRLRRAGVPF